MWPFLSGLQLYLTNNFQYFYSTEYKFTLQFDSLALGPFLLYLKQLFILFYLLLKDSELSILTFN